MFLHLLTSDEMLLTQTTQGRNQFRKSIMKLYEEKAKIYVEVRKGFFCVLCVFLLIFLQASITIKSKLVI